MSDLAALEDRLLSLPLFAGLSRSDVRRLTRHMTPLEVRAGRVLTREGDPGTQCVLILEGTADVHRGRELIASVGPGDVVGEIALLDGGPRTATVTAVTDMTLEVLSPREFASALAERPEVARRVLATLARRIRALDDRAMASLLDD